MWQPVTIVNQRQQPSVPLTTLDAFGASPYS
jgi:hypothetical protein